MYLNNGTISTMKNELAIFVNCFVLGQIIPALNSPTDIESYQCKSNEVKIVQSLYGLSNGKFLGLEKRLGYVILRGDPEEVFFSYGFNPETSKLLFSSSEERIPNAFTSTAFRKHYKKLWKSIALKRSRTYSSLCPVPQTGRKL